jgi:hypothetical protein
MACSAKRLEGATAEVGNLSSNFASFYSLSSIYSGNTGRFATKLGSLFVGLLPQK